MLYDLRLRVTTPFLGDQRHPDSPRRFRRSDTEDWWLIDISQWQWACKEAAKSLGLTDVDTSQVHFTEKFRRPAAVLYRRNFTKGTKQEHEMFEAINKNTVLTFEIFLPDVAQQRSLRPPDKEELRKIFEFVGQYVGLSPWGSRYGFGRFQVEDMRLADDALARKLLSQRISRLPAQFMESNRASADEIVFLGFPLTVLSRQELLAVAAFLKTQLESPIRHQRDEPDNRASTSGTEGGADVRTEKTGSG